MGFFLVPLVVCLLEGDESKELDVGCWMDEWEDVDRKATKKDQTTGEFTGGNLDATFVQSLNPRGIHLIPSAWKV